MFSVGVGQARAAGVLAATVTGPATIPTSSQVSFTVTVSNTGDATAHGIVFTVGFPDTPNENWDGGSCPIGGDGAGNLTGSVPDLEPTGSFSCFVLVSNIHQGGIVYHHPWTVSSADSGSVSGEYDLTADTPPPGPPPVPQTTITASLSGTVKVRGLTGSQVAMVTNTGPNPATNLHVSVSEFDEFINVIAAEPSSGSCQLFPRGIACDVANLPAGASLTITMTVRMKPFISGFGDAILAFASNSGPNVTGSGDAFFHDHYWPCGCAASTWENGWTVPGVPNLGAGLVVDPDDTVHLPDGFLILPDGTLLFPDGRRIVLDTSGHPTFIDAPAAPPSTPPPAPPAPPPPTPPSAPTATPPATPPAGQPGASKAPALLQGCTVVGRARVGKTIGLRAARFTVAPAGISFAWQKRLASGRWQTIAKSSHLRLARGLAGHRLRVVETARFSGRTITAASPPVLVRS